MFLFLFISPSPTLCLYFLSVVISVQLSLTLSLYASSAYPVFRFLPASALFLCSSSKYILLSSHCLPGLIHLSLCPRPLCRTHTPMQTSCWRRPSSWPRRESATQRRSTRPPTSSKTESKTLYAAWSSAKSCWTCLSPSTRTSKR